MQIMGPLQFFLHSITSFGILSSSVSYLCFGLRWGVFVVKGAGSIILLVVKAPWIRILRFCSSLSFIIAAAPCSLLFIFSSTMERVHFATALMLCLYVILLLAALRKSRSDSLFSGELENNCRSLWQVTKL